MATSSSFSKLSSEIFLSLSCSPKKIWAFLFTNSTQLISASFSSLLLSSLLLEYLKYLFLGVYNWLLFGRRDFARDLLDLEYFAR